MLPRVPGFVDAGGVMLNHVPFGPDDRTRHLTGAGVAFNRAVAHGSAMRAAWAWKLGPEDAQADKDRSGRGWIVIGRTF